MTSRDFAYWLQGFFEIYEPQTINKQQVEIIKNHLNLVFKHEIDPSLNEGKTKVEVKELQDVHDGKVKKPTPPPTQIIREGEDPKPMINDEKVDWKKMLKDGPPPKKDEDVFDWLKDKFKPSTNIKPNKSNGGWSSGSSDSTLLRC